MKGHAPPAARTTRSEFLLFCAVGASNTVLSLCLYWLLLDHSGHTIAYGLACCVGTVYSAFLNSRLTFSTRLTGRSFVRFAFMTLGLYLINAALLEVLVRLLAVDARYAILIVTAVGIPLGFLGSRMLFKARITAGP